MTSSTHLPAMFSLGWSQGRTPWEIGNCDFLFSLEQFQEGIREKVHVEAIFCTWITEKKKDTNSLQKKKFFMITVFFFWQYIKYESYLLCKHKSSCLGGRLYSRKYTSQVLPHFLIFVERYGLIFIKTKYKSNSSVHLLQIYKLRKMASKT